MENLARQLNNKIKESNEYINYLKYKNIINRDEKLTAIKEKMNSLKKTICKSKDDNLVDEYYRLEDEYNSNSSVKEYKYYASELKKLLDEVVDILSVN